MPGSGGGFAVEVRWLGADEGPLDDGLLKPLSFSNAAGRTVQSFADHLFKKHADTPTFSGKSSKKVVAYSGPIDGDEAEEGAPVALHAIVERPSRLTLRPRISMTDSVFMVVYTSWREGKKTHNVLCDLPLDGESFATIAPARFSPPLLLSTSILGSMAQTLDFPSWSMETPRSLPSSARREVGERGEGSRQKGDVGSSQTC